MNKETAQRLFNHMSEEHGVTLLETDMQEIERILSEPCSRHECHEHTESPSPMEGKTPLKGWVAVYRDKKYVCYAGNIWSSKQVCQDLANDGVIAIIDLSKHHEGEGL